MAIDYKHYRLPWPTMIGGGIVTGFLSLGVHILMLQGLGIPFPGRVGVPAWASLLNVALAVAALMYLDALLREQTMLRLPWRRWLVLAALYATLKEALRGNIMNAVVTTAWTFSAAQTISPVLYSLVLAGLVVLVGPRASKPALRLVAAAVIALVMSFAVKPTVGAMLSPLMSAIAHLDHADVYPFPYGWHVMIWAYLTYAEPVIAAFVTAALVWPQLRGRRGTIVKFTVMIAAIKGAILPTFLFSQFDKAGPAVGMLSESQFLFEALLLGLLAGATWTWVDRTKAISKPVTGPF